MDHEASHFEKLQEVSFEDRGGLPGVNLPWALPGPTPNRPLSLIGTFRGKEALRVT